MIMLGIETSCDETSAALVKDGRDVLACTIHSQIAQHQPYGGVVPEIASRSHVEVLPSVIRKTLTDAGITWSQIGAIAATHGPGLASSLLIGFSAAKALALSQNKPLIPINHLEAHLYAIFLGSNAPSPNDVMPLLGLLVSGGHTCLIRMDHLNQYTLLGQTIDDAAGEALDKGASLLSLGYPGGPIVEKTAQHGNPTFVRFPRGKVRNVTAKHIDPNLCFSFSGVKTSLKYHLKKHPEQLQPETLPDLAASYQEAILDALAKRFSLALQQTGVHHAACGGGVACNKTLRSKLTDAASKNHCTLHMAEPKYCTDNAAMVAGLAHHRQDASTEAVFSQEINPNLTIGKKL